MVIPAPRSTLAMGATMIVRDQLQDSIRNATARNDKGRLSTLRLMQTAIRDRDQAHCVGNGERITEGAVAELLHKMIRQRDDERAAALEAGDTDAVTRIDREIATIREFVPPVMDDSTLHNACAEVVSEIGATGLRDVGRTLTALKRRYPGRVDLSRASCVVKGMLR